MSARVIVCGGQPSPHDLEVLQEFAAALALPTDRERRLALLEMNGADQIINAKGD